MTHIASITTGRADIGILAPVWQALRDEGAALSLFASGMHMHEHAAPLPSLPEGTQVHRGGCDIGGHDAAACAAAMAEITRDAAQFYQTVQPDLVLVIGDRLDMFPAASAAVPFNLPLAHLHGGEVTLGALDDRLRHAISKLAHVHCVASKSARDCLLAMGEHPDRITLTGAPGLDTLRAAPEMDQKAFAQRIGMTKIDGLRLVTVHPETNAADPLAPLQAVLDALADTPGPALFTAPNSDPGGEAIRAQIQVQCSQHEDWHFVETLGGLLFANALRHASMMIGNSSSGILEAGLFGLPVIDVGDRQAGRESAPSVQHVPATREAVTAALHKIARTTRHFNSETPYGDGHSGPRVARALIQALTMPDLLEKPAPSVPPILTKKGSPA